MVLVVVGMVMGAVMVGKDVLIQAKGQQAFSVFVSGWREAFAQYVQVTGRVPGDTNPPGNIVNASASANGATPLCGVALANDFLQAGIRIPQGRGVGQETTFAYQDSVGSPQVLSVCFRTVVAGDPLALSGWSVQTALLPVPAFGLANRHVMEISGLTTELAMQMDVLIDGGVSARFGQFRVLNAQSVHSTLNAAPVGWGSIETVAGDQDSARSLVIGLFEMF